MKQLLTLPTWIIAKLTIPFLPKNHAWKNKKFTLKDWADHSTNLNNQFSLTFWSFGIIFSTLLFFLLFK